MAAVFVKPQFCLFQPTLKTQTPSTLALTSSIALKKTAHRTTTLFVVANANANANANGDADTSPVVVADRLTNQDTPWLMLPPEEDKISGDKLDCFYSMADGQTLRLNRKKSLKVPETANCFGSTIGSWLAFVDTKDGALYLTNPFYNEVVELPSLEFQPSVVGVERDPDSGSILNFKVQYENPSWDSHDIYEYDLEDPETMAHFGISHLALSFDDPRHPTCVAMAVLGEPGRVAYCPIGKKFNPDNQFYYKACTINDGTFWKGLQEDYFPGVCSKQVVYSRKNDLFYTLFDDCGIQAYDVERHRGWRSKKVYEFTMQDLRIRLDAHFGDDEVVSESLKEIRKMCHTKFYLVTLSNGDLLLIVRHYLEDYGSIVLPFKPRLHLQDRGSGSGSPRPPYKTVHFDVFRVTYPGELEPVRSLEDRAVFIGQNQSFCIDAYTSPGIMPNAIHFTDDRGLDWGHDMGIFEMSNGVIRPCYTYEDEGLMEVPFTKPLFWVAPITSRHRAIENGLLREYCSEG